MKALLGCRSFCDALAGFSYRGPGMKILGKVCYNSVWEDLVEVLAKSSRRSLHDHVQVLEVISYGDPVAILQRRSLR